MREYCCHRKELLLCIEKERGLCECQPSQKLNKIMGLSVGHWGGVLGVTTDSQSTTYRGRVEIGGVYLLSQLSADIVKGDGRASPTPQQAGLIFPS